MSLVSRKFQVTSSRNSINRNTGACIEANTILELSLSMSLVSRKFEVTCGGNKINRNTGACSEAKTILELSLSMSLVSPKLDIVDGACTLIMWNTQLLNIITALHLEPHVHIRHKSALRKNVKGVKVAKSLAKLDRNYQNGSQTPRGFLRGLKKLYVKLSFYIDIMIPGMIS